MNITNIINLFRAYFIENKKILLILCIITFSIAAFGFVSFSTPGITTFVPYLLLLWIAGTFFQFSLKKNNSTLFFNLPATTMEKFIHAVWVIILVGIVLRILTIAGAYTGHYLFRLFIYSEESNEIVNGISILKLYLESSLSDYLINGAVVLAFLFGSIYFRRNSFIKTVVITISFLFAMAIHFIVLLYAIFGKGAHKSINIDISDFLFLQNYYCIIPIALALFFLSLTWLRLRETEV